MYKYISKGRGDMSFLRHLFMCVWLNIDVDGRDGGMLPYIYKACFHIKNKVKHMWCCLNFKGSVPSFCSSFFFSYSLFPLVFRRPFLIHSWTDWDETWLNLGQNLDFSSIKNNQEKRTHTYSTRKRD